jgi:rod shape determining protein RodA
MIDRSLLRHIDWLLIFLLLLNSFVGVAFIYSSSHYLSGNYHMRQLFWIGVGLIALFLLLSIDYHHLLALSPYFYVFCLLLLTGVLIFGSIISGAKSWFRLPFIQIQPSEITKLAVILILAGFFSKFRRYTLSFVEGMMSAGLVLLPTALVVLQPDLGTALIYVPILLATVILAGLNRKMVILFLIVSLLLGIVGWNFILKDYQKQRITTLLYPEQDPLGSGYQITQSKIAVGSGGLFGKGYKKGTQSQLRFLPARHTDFVFSVIGEEVGFTGVILVLGVYFLLLLRLFQSVERSRDRAGVYICFLVAFLITSQAFINILMTVGLFPVAGIPLPLLSYGGASLLTNYIAVSLVINVKMRRFVNV